MVNKAVVGVIGVVLIATLGVGALVGLQGGGGPAEEGSPNANDGNGAPAETEGEPTEEDSTNTGTTNTATTTDSDSSEEVSLRQSEFTRTEVEENVTRLLNEWRSSEGLARLSTDTGTTADNLHEMARAHSDRMAATGETAHTIENSTIESRYRSTHDLYNTCGFEPPGEAYIANPGDPNPQTFEWIASTEVSSSFTRDDGIRYHETESAVAAELVDQWRNEANLDHGLLSSNYDATGVGVNVTSDGTVYTTVHLCGR